MTMFAVVEGDKPPMLLAPLVEGDAGTKIYAAEFTREAHAAHHPQEVLIPLANTALTGVGSMDRTISTNEALQNPTTPAAEAAAPFLEVA